VLLYLYEAHLQLHLRPEKHVIQFYWDPNRSVTQFILQSLCDDLNYILPIAIPSTIALLMSLLPIVALNLLLRLRSGKRGYESRFNSSILVLVLLLLELIVLGVTGHYPFGGEARQQSIIFPFVLLSGFQALIGASRFFGYR